MIAEFLVGKGLNVLPNIIKSETIYLTLVENLRNWQTNKQANIQIK